MDPASYDSAKVVLLLMFLPSLIVAAVRPEWIGELTVKWFKAEFSYKKAPSADVDRSLAYYAEQLKQDPAETANIGAEATPEAVDAAQEKKEDDRTDADYLSLANFAWQEQRFNEAYQYAIAGIDRPSSDLRIRAALHSRLSTTLTRVDLSAQAEWHAQRAIAVDPEFAPAYSNLGVLLLGRRAREAALATIQEAVRLDSQSAYARNNLGVAHAELGSREEAMVAFRMAIQIDADYANAHMNLANELMLDGKMDEAEAEYRTSIELNPGNASAWNGLGALLKALGDLEGAEREFRKALELIPDYAQAHSNLGVVLTNLKRFDEAQRSLNLAIALRPDLPGLQGNLQMLRNRRDAAGPDPAD